MKHDKSTTQKIDSSLSAYSYRGPKPKRNSLADWVSTKIALSQSSSSYSKQPDDPTEQGQVSLLQEEVP